MDKPLFEIEDFKARTTQSFRKQQLPGKRQAVFDSHDVPFRTKPTLIGEVKDFSEEIRVKFATMNMYPDNKEANPGAPKCCEEHDIIGVGWGNELTKDEATSLGPTEITQNFFDYKERDGRPYNDFAHFALWLTPGDIVITKNLGSVVSYARVKGPIKHKSQSDVVDELEKHEIGYYREVEWTEVQAKDAPAMILSTTCRGTLSLPKLDKITMEQVLDQFEYPIGDAELNVDKEKIREIFKELADEPDDSTNSNRLISSLSASGECNGLETAVCTYIQHKTGAAMHPSSRSLPLIESIFRKTTNDSPRTYGIQVKRGNFEGEKSALKKFAEEHDKLYLFSLDGDQVMGENIVNISSSELSEYICNQPYDLPPVEIDRLLRTYNYLQN